MTVAVPAFVFWVVAAAVVIVAASLVVLLWYLIAAARAALAMVRAVEREGERLRERARRALRWGKALGALFDI